MPDPGSRVKIPGSASTNYFLANTVLSILLPGFFLSQTVNNAYKTKIRIKDNTVSWRNTVLSSCCCFFSPADLQKVPFSSTFYATILLEILFDQLLAVDQLTAVRQSGEAFSELEESTPTFPPTFKVRSSTGFFRFI
jgi:hypothetical protein